MDLHALGQKNIDEVKNESLSMWLKATEKNKPEDQSVKSLDAGLDTASANSLDDLKQASLKAQEPGRAAYIEKLKAAVASGEYDISADAIADGMLDDGFAEFLIEE